METEASSLDLPWPSRAGHHLTCPGQASQSRDATVNRTSLISRLSNRHLGTDGIRLRANSRISAAIMARFLTSRLSRSSGLSKPLIMNLQCQPPQSSYSLTMALTIPPLTKECAPTRQRQLQWVLHMQELCTCHRLELYVMCVYLFVHVAIGKWSVGTSGQTTHQIT